MKHDYSSRSKAREIAVSTLYSLDFNGELDTYNDYSTFPGMTEEEMMRLEEVEKSYARLLVKGTLENRKEIDSIISSYSINRPLEKISIVDRNILRISFFQLLYQKEIPSAVVIDQGVKLSQALSNDVSYKFINGILDKFVKDRKDDSTQE